MGQDRAVRPQAADTVRRVTPDPARARGDTARRDSTARDTSAKELIKWNDADSVMKALMSRPGYTATRYQGDQAVFDARTGTLHLIGKRAGVNREQTVVV